MNPECPECGARLEDGRSCRDYFHDLLILESQVQGAAGALPHFLAVASYNLQHPSTFIPSALFELRGAMADVLTGRTTLDRIRQQVRRSTNGAVRVMRREDMVLSLTEETRLRAWPRVWDMTVRDVCQTHPDQYVDEVRQWAESVIVALDARIGRLPAV